MRVLASNATNLAISEIERRDRHGASLSMHDIWKNFVIFETEARSIRIIPCKSLQDHIARLQEYGLSSNHQ